MKFLQILLRSKTPELKRKIIMAHLDFDVKEFIHRANIGAIYSSLTLGLLGFLMIDKFIYPQSITKTIIATIITWIIAYIGMLFFMLHTIDTYVVKRRREMDQEVLFAGRYLLVKMHAGIPFFNALIDASKIFGFAGKFFKEIIDDVNTGTPIEKALDKASEYSPSKKFAIIIREVNNALKLGVDISNTLSLILDDIAYEQLEEIRRFGKKMNAMAMFYMIIAVVMPSLGISLAIVLASFMGLQFTLGYLMFFVFLLIFLQFMFLALFKTIRPTVNI